jgi:hypothetical protein
MILEGHKDWRRGRGPLIPPLPSLPLHAQVPHCSRGAGRLCSAALRQPRSGCGGPSDSLRGAGSHRRSGEAGRAEGCLSNTRQFSVSSTPVTDPLVPPLWQASPSPCTPSTWCPPLSWTLRSSLRGRQCALPPRWRLLRRPRGRSETRGTRHCLTLVRGLGVNHRCESYVGLMCTLLSWP